jgi:hypothetical protein
MYEKDGTAYTVQWLSYGQLVRRRYEIHLLSAPKLTDSLWIPSSFLFNRHWKIIPAGKVAEA